MYMPLYQNPLKLGSILSRNPYSKNPNISVSDTGSNVPRVEDHGRKPISTLGSSKRRDKLYIIAEILDIAKEGTLKTQVMYRANLSFTQLNDYLKFMLKIELLEEVLRGDKKAYKATTKGQDFLQRYHEITELLKTGDKKDVVSLMDVRGTVKLHKV